MKKTDLFVAKREMSERVAEFMRTRVWGITLKARCKKQIDELICAINGMEKLRGSVLWDETEKAIAELNSQIVEHEEKLAKQLEEEAKFSYTQNDKTFYDAYKEAKEGEGVATAICNWFAEYELTVTGENDIVASIMDAISGKRKASATTVIRSGAERFVEDKRSKGEVLGLLYGVLAERMLEVGTLKPTAIQDDVKEFYAPKQKAKKSK